MMKSIGFLPRRAELSRKEFQDYYEARHAPLALPLFPFTKYVRNHLRDQDDIGFDTISEFWFPDADEIQALMRSAVGDTMRADERRFMAQARIGSAVTQEHLIAGPARGVESGPVLKEALLIGWNGKADKAARAAQAWGRSLAREAGNEILRLTIDIIEPWPGTTFPYDAVLWAWLGGSERVLLHATPPAEIDVRGIVLTQSIETAPELLGKQAT